MSDFSCNIEYLQDIEKSVFISLQGAIDANTVPIFKEQLDNIRDEGYINIIIDLAEIRYVNSTGVGYFVELADSSGQEGGSVILTRIQPKVKIIFDMLGLISLFKLLNSKKEAIAYLKEKVSKKAEVEEVVEIQPSQKEEEIKKEEEKVEVSEEKEVLTKIVKEVPKPQRLKITCNICRSELLVSEPANYKCPRCHGIFTVQKDFKVTYITPKEHPPCQFTLTSTEESAEGLSYFSFLIAQKIGLEEEKCYLIKSAVKEVASAISNHSYGKNPYCIFNVLIQPQAGNLKTVFSDYGKKFELEDLESHYPTLNKLSSEKLATLEIKPHPKGGNIVTIIF